MSVARCAFWPVRRARIAAARRGGIGRSWARFGSCNSGSAGILFGLLLTITVALIGSAVDLGRWLHARAITIAALDSAVLSAGRILQVNNSDEATALATAESLYKENTRQRAKLKKDTIKFVITDNGTAISAEGEARIETSFMNLVSIDSLPLLNLSGSEFSKAVLAIGGHAEQNIEISLMLDVSGSMGSGTKFQDMKLAAKDLINIVVYDNQGTFYSKVAVAPFSSQVRPPAAILDAVRGPGPFKNQKPLMQDGKTDTHHATACVAERVGDERFSDAAPGPDAYVMPAYWGDKDCEIGKETEVMSLSNDKAALLSKIDGLGLSGSTAGHLGTAWAWYMLSPAWASILPDGSKPGAYGQDKLKKIAILMTDGEYNTQYCSTGEFRGVRDKNSWAKSSSQKGSCTAANGKSASQAIELCKGMKARGITVYTVGFDLGGNAAAIDTLATCATDETKFYNAVSGDQLRQAFRDIAVKISNLYLSR